jgi:hypothetical protein
VTLAPEVHPAIRGVAGKPVERNTTCAAPGCISMSQDGHHMWPRSYLQGQPYDWVKLPSGKVVSNVIGLCRRHHDDVTSPIGGHRAQIKLLGDEFIWLDLTNEGMAVDMGPLFPQPSVKAAEVVAPPEVATRHGHVDLSEGQTCESCGYTRPRKTKMEPARAVASWTALVPNDSEIGTEILDEWVDQLAVMLGFGDEPRRLTRYHVLSASLAWVMMNRQAFLGDIVAAAEA